MRGSDDEKNSTPCFRRIPACPESGILVRTSCRTAGSGSKRARSRLLDSSALASAFVTARWRSRLPGRLHVDSRRSTYYTQTYIEALAEDNALETPENVSPVHLDLAEPGR